MSKREHRTLVADTDTTVTVDSGRGMICVWNHDTTANKPVFVKINAAIGALREDDCFAVSPGRPRVIGAGDGDNSTDVHLRGVSAAEVSVELLSPGEEEWVL